MGGWEGRKGVGKRAHVRPIDHPSASSAVQLCCNRGELTRGWLGCVLSYLPPSVQSEGHAFLFPLLGSTMREYGARGECSLFSSYSFRALLAKRWAEQISVGFHANLKCDRNRYILAPWTSGVAHSGDAPVDARLAFLCTTNNCQE